MKVAILCGGQGTRLREVADTIPKPMVPIGGRPIIWHIMKIYASHGISDFVLLLGYKGDVIRNYFLNFAAQTSDVTIDLRKAGADSLTFHRRETEDWRVSLVETGDHTMTGARVRRACDYLEDEDDFCLTYGDGVGDVDVARLIAFHKDHGKTATVTGVYPPSRFGELSVERGNVRTFNEKPQVTGGFISGGFFVFKRSFLRHYLEDTDDLILEREPMERLAKDGELMMYEHTGFWQPMDTPREYALLNDLWANDQAAWKVW